MSAYDFQQSFMRTAKSSYNLNLDILEGYKDVARQAVEELDRDIQEIKYVKAHMPELENIGRQKMFFDNLTLKYKSNLRKCSVELTHEIADSYRNLDKKIKSTFMNEDISQKDIYKCIEENSEAEISAFIASAEQINFDTELVNTVQEDISAETQRIIKNTKRKIKTCGIYVPILILIAIVSSIVILGMVQAHTNIAINESTSTSGSEIKETEGILEESIDTGELAVGVAKKVGVSNILLLLDVAVSLLLWAIIALVLVFIAIWLVYYTITARKLRKKMLSELEVSVGRICTNFSTRKNELVEAYIVKATSHLNEINTKYFSKFQPLIAQVIQKGDR